MGELILGVHVAKVSKILNDKKPTKTMLGAIHRDTDTLTQLNAAQIFTHGPRNSRKNNMDYNAIKKLDIDMTVHSAYPTVVIWRVNKENKNTDKSKRYIKMVADQLASCRDIDAWGLVLHVNKYPPEHIAWVMGVIIKPLCIKYKTNVVLEMVSSKAAADTYESPEKINKLTKLIGSTYGYSFWSWCVDTAHIHGAGVSIDTYEKAKKWIDKINRPKSIHMLHLNGSSAALGSGIDKHEIAFSPDDVIWKNIKWQKSGLKAFVELAIKNSATVICEINRGDEKHTKKLFDVIMDIAGL